MARTKAPAPRGFTLAEKRSITFERISLGVVFLVAVIAALISFQALAWVGQQMGLGIAAYLVPVAVDGFAIACSVGVVRSQASGEKVRDRLSEWTGITLALALSVWGNVTHALHIGTGVIPRELTVAVSAAVPFIVAYGIHVYGRAMIRGISAHVLADDPDHLHADLWHLGDDRLTAAQAGAPVRVGTTKAARVESAPQPRATIERAPAAARDDRPAARATSDDAHEQVFVEYRTRRAAGDRMQGGEIADRTGLSPGHARRLRGQWDARIADELEVAAPDRDPIAEQVDGAPRESVARTA